jgi:uncharacterized membrane protein HdeD (DUF308 family)
MRCNVGGADRTVRIVAGIVLIAVGLLYPLSVAWQTAVFVVGVIALLTGLMRFCPISALVGRNTCKQGPSAD